MDEIGSNHFFILQAEKMADVTFLFWTIVFMYVAYFVKLFMISTHLVWGAHEKFPPGSQGTHRCWSQFMLVRCILGSGIQRWSNGLQGTEATVSAGNPRITSYNVCYTKLLRHWPTSPIIAWSVPPWEDGWKKVRQLYRHWVDWQYTSAPRPDSPAWGAVRCNWWVYSRRWPGIWDDRRSP